MAEPTFPPGFPEEFKQQVLDVITHNRMKIEDFQHGVATFLDGLDKEQLVGFKGILHYLGYMQEGDTSSIAYLEGVTTGLLHVKFAICLGCEHDHEELMRNAGMREESSAMDGGNPYQPAPERNDLQLYKVGMLSDTQIARMAEYNLDDVRDENDGALLGFICLGCKTRYPSIEDRMIKPPGKEGCSGCIQKEKWG